MLTLNTKALLHSLDIQHDLVLFNQPLIFSKTSSMLKYLQYSQSAVFGQFKYNTNVVDSFA